MIFFQTTPKSITPKIREWTRTISTHDPLFVKVEPQKYSIQQACYLNCLLYWMQNPTAKIIPGWIAWEGAFVLELEHHSIMQLPDGSYVDPTPTVDGENKILFLPEPERIVKFEGINVHRWRNIVHPATKTSLEIRRCFARNMYAKVSEVPEINPQTREVLAQLLSQFPQG